MQVEKLIELRDAYQEMEAYAEVINKLKLQAMKITTIISEVPKNQSSVKDGIASPVIGIIMLEEEWKKLIYQWTQKRDAVIEEIKRLPNVKERAVLMLRYVGVNTWEQIANIMIISESTVFRIHKKALRNYKNMIVNESKKQ